MLKHDLAFIKAFKIISPLCCIALSTIAANSQTPKEHDPISIKLIPTGGLWWSGSTHIPLKCTITNRSGAAIRFLPPDINPVLASFCLDMEVRDSKGQLFRITSGLLSSMGGEIRPENYLTLPDGASYTFGLHHLLGDFYEYRPSGTYTIRFKFTVPDTPLSEKLQAEDVCIVTSTSIKDHLVSKPMALIPVVVKGNWRVRSRITGYCAIAERTKGEFWLVYWYEELPKLPVVDQYLYEKRIDPYTPPPIKRGDKVNGL